MRSLKLADASQVAEARRAAVAVAEQIGFGAEDAGRVAIVTTELSTNLLKHGGGGELLVGSFDDGDGAGVELVALDHGPGIPDLKAAMRDGHSTAGSPGTGLGAVSRLSSEMDVYAKTGSGAAVLARVTEGRKAKSLSRALSAGAVRLPMAGEEACGDAWCVRREPGALTAMVIDGLGHGPMAAVAAHAGVSAFTQGGNADLVSVERLHAALKPTRGAAASIVRLPSEGDIEFIGVGNVAGVVSSGGEERRMVGYNGTLGHALKTVRPFRYEAGADALVVLASDGLGTSWSLDAYPALRLRHPTLIAAVLYRDFNRGRDDITVLVARREAA